MKTKYFLISYHTYVPGISTLEKFGLIVTLEDPAHVMNRLAYPGNVVDYYEQELTRQQYFHVCERMRKDRIHNALKPSENNTSKLFR